MEGGGHSAFFQDCEVARWDAEACSKKCATGEQKLTRNVLTHSNGGARCLPLAALRSCNDQPCPVNCKLESWSGWSKCSAECGGGVSQRLREVTMNMKNGGNPCGETSETKACNGQACEEDCELKRWTKWSDCSKDCDGGTRKRQRYIKKQAKGGGKCDGPWSPKRLQYKECAMKRCKLPLGEKILTCSKRMDIVLLIDGSTSMGKAGFAKELTAANNLIGAFSKEANFAVILFSGPRTWRGVNECVGKGTKNVDLEKDCKIKTVSHFTQDLEKLKELITALEWPQGRALTSLALTSAKAELSLGRKTAESTVIVFGAGKPNSDRLTMKSSILLRKSARVMWVPVDPFNNPPQKLIMKFATRRWQENVISVKSMKELDKPLVTTRIVANICPSPEFALK